MKLRKILWVSVAAVLFCLTGCADKNGSGANKTAYLQNMLAAQASLIIRLYWKSMNAHISKPVEMEVLKKTIKSIKINGWGAQIPISKLCRQDMEMRFVR